MIANLHYKNSVLKIILAFLLITLLFPLMADPADAAKPNDCTITTQYEEYNHTYVRFTDADAGTTWEVRARYEGFGFYSGWGFYRSTGQYYDGIEIRCYYPRPGDRVTWMTTCVDPTVDVVASTSSGGGGNVDVFQHRATVNVNCASSRGWDFRACDGREEGRGLLGFNEPCPSYRYCAIRGVVTASTCIRGVGTTCGTGSERCNTVRNQCEFVGTPSCYQERVNTNVTGCIGEDGCCLNNNNCSGGGTYCGSGNDACTLYRNVCGSNKRCQVNTVDTESTYCANNTYWACQNDGECGSSRFCRNPNPCGICTDYDQINGRVFIDLNRNNQWDGGSTDSTAGMGNKTVERSPTGANNWRSTTTSSNGQYSFDQLRNPSNQDVRIIPSEFGLYDPNHCTYADIIRSSYQGNIQSSPGHRRNNIDPTPNLTGVLFMLRAKSYAVGGAVYEDTNNNGVIDIGTDRRFRRFLSEDVIVRVNDAATGAFVANDTLYKDPSGYNASRDGNYWISGLVHNKRYNITLNVPSLSGVGAGPWYVVGSNSINNVLINCSNNGGNNFLVTNGPPPPGQPDLSIDSFIIPDGNPGDTVTATIRVVNEGTETTGVGFNIRLRHNNLTQTINIPATTLTPSQTGSYTRTITLPATVGTYNADLFVDSANAVTESNEGNNTITTTYEVLPPGTTPTPPPGGTPPPPPPPNVDLDITSFSVSDGIPGSPTNGSITITNNGTGNTLIGFTINISNGDGSSINITQSALAGGASTSPISFNITTPPTAGTYTATATVDSTNAIAESNEGNNTATTSYQAIDLPDIQGGVFIDDVDNTNASDGIKQTSESYTSGTITISNGIGSFESANPGGFLAQDVPEASYTISFDAANDLPQGWEMTYPIAGIIPPNPFVINVTPGSSCSTGTHDYATCEANGDITSINFGIRQIPADPWFNGIGGDMRSDNPLENRIPEAANTYFSETGPNSTAGIVFGDSLILNPLTTNATNVTNPDNWLVERDFAGVIQFSYASVLENLRKGGNLPSTLGGGNVSPGSISTPGVYNYSNDVTLSGGRFNFINGNYVVLVNGDLRIENNISVEKGSTAIFIVNGDITIAPSVIFLGGIFSANSTFIVEGKNDGTEDDQLLIEGSVIGLGGSGFDNQRDLLRVNETTPAVQIIYRPDFILFAPELIKFSNYTIREVAPGAE